MAKLLKRNWKSFLTKQLSTSKVLVSKQYQCLDDLGAFNFVSFADEQPISANIHTINMTTSEVDKELREESSRFHQAWIVKCRILLGIDELQRQLNRLNHDINEFDQSERPTDRLVKTNDKRRCSDPN